MSDSISVIVRCVAALGLTACVGPEPSAEPQQPRATAPAPAVQQPEAAAPTPAALRDMLTRSAGSMRVTKRPDGLTQLDTPQGFRSASVAYRAPDGQLQQRCVHTPEELEHMHRESVGGER